MIFGVDSHRSSLSVAGVDELGRVQVAVSFGNRPSEHLKLVRRVRRHAATLVGIEGSGKYGHALAQVLQRSHATCVSASRPPAQASCRSAASGRW